MRIYLDNCCFNRPFDRQDDITTRLETEAKLYIQSQIKAGTLKLVWSYILDFENSRNPFLFKQQAIAAWRKLAVMDVEETDEIIQQAKILYNKGLKSHDALHLACAFAGKCEYFFTTDKGILRKTQMLTNLKVLNPIMFLTSDNS
jgi:predicted nucleic acid-binding protein